MQDGSLTRIKTNLDKFFSQWVAFTRPFHKLSPSEGHILSIMLKKRYELSEMIKDDNLIDMNLMSEQSRIELSNEAGLTRANLQTMFSKLRKAGIIVDNRIDSRFIPNLSLDGKLFNFGIIFEIER